MRALRYIDDRFWQKVARAPGDRCWTWLGSYSPNGYGRFQMAGHNEFAHRAAYRLFRGVIPNGLQVCHHCDNPACVRPDHLFLGTQHDNVRDMLRKGRAAWQRKRAA